MEIIEHPDAPHQAVIYIQAEVHEVLPTGELSGRPVVKINRFPITFHASDKNLAERKLNEFLEEIKTKCQQI